MSRLVLCSQSPLGKMRLVFLYHILLWVTPTPWLAHFIIICICVVNCPMPSDPMNGMINCSIGDDGVLSYEDTCTVTCDTGYMLTGDDMRTSVTQ